MSALMRCVAQSRVGAAPADAVRAEAPPPEEFRVIAVRESLKASCHTKRKKPPRGGSLVSQIGRGSASATWISLSLPPMYQYCRVRIAQRFSTERATTKAPATAAAPMPAPITGTGATLTSPTAAAAGAMPASNASKLNATVDLFSIELSL